MLRAPEAALSLSGLNASAEPASQDSSAVTVTIHDADITEDLLRAATSPPASRAASSSAASTGDAMQELGMAAASTSLVRPRHHDDLQVDINDVEVHTEAEATDNELASRGAVSTDVADADGLEADSAVILTTTPPPPASTDKATQEHGVGNPSLAEPSRGSSLIDEEVTNEISRLVQHRMEAIRLRKKLTPSRLPQGWPGQGRTSEEAGQAHPISALDNMAT